MSSRPTMTWVTNIAPPYRLALWRELARLVDLRVLLYADTEPGRHWEPPVLDGAVLRRLPTLRLTRGETHLYVLAPGALRHEPPADTVVIGGWESPASWSVRRWARRSGARTVAFYESIPGSQRFATGPVADLRSRFLTGCDAVLTPGVAATRAAVEAGVDPRRIVTSFNAVDVDEWRASLALRSDAEATGHRYLYVGQLLPRKNVGALLAAFAAVRRAGDTLTIAGSGPLEATLKAQSPDGVRWLGHVPHADLPALYASADTLVLPSLQEVWGLVVNEALSAGLHAVVSDRCGVAPSVAHMAGVHTCQPTAEDLVRAMHSTRDRWCGPIGSPPILDFGPAEFARDCADQL